MQQKRKGSSLWYWLLIIPFIATLWLPFYASQKPEWGGVPFFYWYQMLWVFLSAILTGIVYDRTKKR